MSASASEPVECAHPVGRLFVGAETRTAESRRSEIRSLNDRAVEKFNSESSAIEPASLLRVPNKRNTQVHFPEPVVSSVRPPSPDVLSPLLPRVTVSGSPSRFIDSVRNVSRLFSPRSSPAVSPVRSPAADFFTWDQGPVVSTPQRGLSPADATGDASVYEDSVSRSRYDPAFSPTSPRRQGTSPSPTRTDVLQLRSRSPSHRIKVFDLLRTPSPRRRLPDGSVVAQGVLNLHLHTPRAGVVRDLQQPLTPIRQVGLDNILQLVDPPDNLQVANAEPLMNVPPAQVVPVRLPNFDDFFDDEDNYINSMATASNLPSFRGVRDDDPRDFIENATLLVDSGRNPDEKSKMALVGISLAGDAKRWYRGLDIRPPHPGGDAAAYPQEAVTTFAQFKELFLERFQRAPADLWREMTGIFAYRQKAGQLTQDYLEELQELAGRASATPEQTLLAAIAGLRNDVKMFCLAHELEDLAAVKKWSDIFDSSCEHPGADVSGAVQRLERLVEKLQVRTSTPPPRASTPQRRVRNADDVDYLPAPPMPRYEQSPPMQRADGPYSAPSQSPSYGSWRGRYQPGRRGYGGRGYQGGPRRQ